ncbi:MAG: alpha/beta hydrolase [Synechococcales cyanobacterium M58_A2018_015]|nr:alpha/beta hydrolase [Synechococcales cyanobacterium M58_A2018_015]
MTSHPFPLPLDDLTEPTSIALAQSIRCQDIMTPLSQEPIPTTFVQQGTAADGSAPLLLLHGFDSSVFEFRRLLPHLSPHRACWAVDLLGFGFTRRVPGITPSPATIKTHLYACWQTWIQQPVVLVGASMGGAAAIDFTLTYPDAVQQLVLIDSAGIGVGPAIGRFLVPPLSNWATAFLRNLKVRQSISLRAYHNPSLASADALRCAALHLEQPGWAEALIAFTRSGGYGSFRQQLARLQQPTLILWGRQDRILGTAAAEQFRQAIPRSQLVWLEHCGHVPHLECPQQTAEAILQFTAASSTAGDASYSATHSVESV